MQAETEGERDHAGMINRGFACSICISRMINILFEMKEMLRNAVAEKLSPRSHSENIVQVEGHCCRS